MPLLRRWQIWVPDARASERRVRYPHWQRLRRSGVPHPVRTSLRIMGWRLMVLSVAMGSIPLWGHLIASTLWWHYVMDPWMAAGRANPMLVHGPPNMTPLFVGQFASIALAATGFLAIGPLTNRGLAKRHAREHLRYHLCPWCCYELTGAPEESGQVMCAECGGFWSATNQGDRTV
jgi:hypothetical protein